MTEKKAKYKGGFSPDKFESLITTTGFMLMFTITFCTFGMAKKPWQPKPLQNKPATLILTPTLRLKTSSSSFLCCLL
ncbi:hypothetical protein C7N43_30920 [Sphingobacteriales bacterium UPWRP_1]|nr:hypothetical protein C7N43_30920 [Sphingobacteriales bacterium UPWRP_1]